MMINYHLHYAGHMQEYKSSGISPKEDDITDLGELETGFKQKAKHSKLIDA